jgi:hypothetical protein
MADTEAAHVRADSSQGFDGRLSLFPGSFLLCFRHGRRASEEDLKS